MLSKRNTVATDNPRIVQEVRYLTASLEKVKALAVEGTLQYAISASNI